MNNKPPNTLFLLCIIAAWVGFLAFLVYRYEQDNPKEPEELKFANECEFCDY